MKKSFVIKRKVERKNGAEKLKNKSFRINFIK